MFSIVRPDLRHTVGPGSVHGRTLMAALIIAAVLASGSAAHAMEVSVIGNTMILSGPVVGDELAKARNMFAQNPAINLAVLRNSWGGHAPTGYRIGELFRDRGMTTAVSRWIRPKDSTTTGDSWTRVFRVRLPWPRRAGTGLGIPAPMMSLRRCVAARNAPVKPAPCAR